MGNLLVKGNCQPSKNSQSSSEVDRLLSRKIVPVFSTRVQSDPLSSIDFYHMKNKTRGIVLIFNNVKFKHMNERKESTEDERKLCTVFTSLHFYVRVELNKTADEMNNIASKVAEEDHSCYDCFIMCILTHGDESGLYGSDDHSITINNLGDPFRDYNCPSLVGKPKLFFIQACQDQKTEPGTVSDSHTAVEATDEVCYQQITDPDFLFVYSSMTGYSSMRTEGGSWFIQTLCEELENNKSMNLLGILTRINEEIADKYSINSTSKQMTSFRSMLTKDLYFN